MNDDFKEELKDCYAEIERLRAALVDIATGQVVELPFIQALARAALSHEQEKHDD